MTYEDLQMINVGLLPGINEAMQKQPKHLKYMMVLWDPGTKHSSMAGNMTPEQMVSFAQHMGDGFEEMSIIDIGATIKQKQ
jgi:hypothetical protein